MGFVRRAALRRDPQRGAGRPASGPDRTVRVDARKATKAEAGYLWPKLVAVNAEYAAYRARTSREIAVVILEPS